MKTYYVTVQLFSGSIEVEVTASEDATEPFLLLQATGVIEDELLSAKLGSYR